METADACEIARLPEELLSAALSLTTPLDACRAAAASRDFPAAADSDAVWACFVPRDLPPLADGELSGPGPASNKRRFLRLSDRPVLLADGLTSMWLDRETGGKCYMLSARALHISWGDTPEYWRWIPLPDSCRFSEGAELLGVCWMEIRGKIDSKMLSQSSTYAAYIVFKIADKSYGLDYPCQASITIAGTTSALEVCLQTYDEEHEDDVGSEPLMQQFGERRRRACRTNLVLPQERTDGWMELEMGQLYNKDSDHSEVYTSLMEVKGGHWKRGLIVHGIEIRPKKDLFVHSSVCSLLPTNSSPTPSLEHPKGHALKPTSAMSKLKLKGEGEAQEAREPMEMADCEIVHLPGELLSAVISLTTPRDTCRAATVSQAFHTAADSDAVWSCFLPTELASLLSTYEVSHAPMSKKDAFLCFSDHRILLAEKLMSMWFDRETGAKCYMLSARKLNIAWDNTPQYWRWIPITGSSFPEVAELRSVCWLEIRGKIDSKMLSQNSPYAAYIVFKVARRAYGLDLPYQETLVSLGGNKSTRRVCLDGYDSDGEDREAEFPHVLNPWSILMPRRRSRLEIPQNVLLPQERADGWKEVEMGEFYNYNDDGEDGEVSISLKETSATLKVGLIVQGIEIRPKKQNGH